MNNQEFSLEQLMELLVTKVGLPASDVSADPRGTFEAVGLDSLAFLQIQAELKARYKVEIPGDRPLSYTFGEIVADINKHLELTKGSMV